VREKLKYYQENNQYTVVIVDDESLFDIECYVAKVYKGKGEYFSPSYGNFLNDDHSEIEIYPIGLDLDTKTAHVLSENEKERAVEKFLEENQ
jgi:hypothetical protein